jgi:hypothetical protein
MNIKAFSIFLISTQVSEAALREDSTLYFRLDGNTVSCDMVRNSADTGSLCAQGGTIAGYVYNHCPTTCGGTFEAKSESDMHFAVLLEKEFGSGNYNDVWKRCDPWVSKTPEITCNKCEKEGVKETCPETCFNCDLPAPSTCKDSSLPFRFHEKKYNCDIVKSDSAFYCGLEGVIPGNVTSHCPAACDVPDCAGNKEETNMYFEILIGGKLKWKQCDPWIMQNNEKHCANRCGKSTVADTCPVTCAKCLV